MITLATTTITATRPAVAVQASDPYGAGYDPAPTPATPTTVATGVRAVIKPGGGRGVSAGAESEVVEFALACDPIPLSYLDTVTDDSSGVAYVVVWALTSPGIAGLGHTTAGLRTMKGTSA